MISFSNSFTLLPSATASLRCTPLHSCSSPTDIMLRLSLRGWLNILSLCCRFELDCAIALFFASISAFSVEITAKGISSSASANMKMLVVLALAALVAAEPEAEAKAAADSYYCGYGLGYGGYGVRTYGGYGLGVYYGGFYGKREAEAEPKAAADPYYYSGYGPTEATDLVSTTVASTESVRLRLSL